jgi:hypothetical protein
LDIYFLAEIVFQNVAFISSKLLLVTELLGDTGGAVIKLERELNSEEESVYQGVEYLGLKQVCTQSWKQPEHVLTLDLWAREQHSLD